MARKRKSRKKPEKKKNPSRFVLPEEIKRIIWGMALFLLAVIIGLSFFDLAGGGGRFLMKVFNFFLGKAAFALPLFLILTALAFFTLKEKNKWPVILAAIFLVLGLSGILEEGWIGYLASWPLSQVFGRLISQIVFAALMTTGGVILVKFLYRPSPKEDKEVKIRSEKPPLIKKVFGPKFKVKPIEPVPAPEAERAGSGSSRPSEIKTSPLGLQTKKSAELPTVSRARQDYHLPPVHLLDSDQGMPTAGDIRLNSAIIKRTLQNFNIQVEMSEVNIGPTVTQYTLKPAEGVKLSKIVALGNDLALALAAHPVRIEAPIPGRPLVGIEVPNKARATVRLRNLIEHQSFQNSISNLTLALGRDVSGNPVFADLARMPHLLVAGSTGTGKTICLNSIILSLLYQNSPEILKLILVDPKRVEFSVYNDLPHLLTPVIYDAQKSVNALKWLIGEMERRFDVLSQERTRDIVSYNERMISQNLEPMPFIVLIVDELADLMAARGREIEAGIVRLAQMARAVGIHLVVATQRPSVEVITGLIKANITSRITFQVASQVDSRTVLDASGAEKLLGLGDMLFISAEISKPKRIQSAFVSDKEVKRVVKYVKSEERGFKKAEELKTSLSESMEKALASEGSDVGGAFWDGEEDPLLEEAKRVVIEAKKASASLLQRRLRVGYARAARLIDMLEERGVVGPGEGAKPRQILVPTEENPSSAGGEEGLEENEGWKKV